MLLPKDERRRRLLHYLRNYQALRRAVAELDEDIAGAQLPTPGALGIAGQGRAARPAERAALRDLARGDALRAWLAAIDAGMAALAGEEPETAEILKRHYRMAAGAGYRRKKATAIRVRVCAALHVSEAEYYRRMEEGLACLQLYAARMGLMDGEAGDGEKPTQPKNAPF